MKHQGFSSFRIRYVKSFFQNLALNNIEYQANLHVLLVLCKHQQNSEAPERLVGLSDDVGAGFISSHSSQPAPATDLNVDRSSDLPQPDDIGNLGVSKVIRADQKKFFFDLGSNNRGHFLRISEVCNGSFIAIAKQILFHAFSLKTYENKKCRLLVQIVPP